MDSSRINDRKSERSSMFSEAISSFTPRAFLKLIICLFMLIFLILPIAKPVVAKQLSQNLTLCDDDIPANVPYTYEVKLKSDKKDYTSGNCLFYSSKDQALSFYAEFKEKNQNFGTFIYENNALTYTPNDNAAGKTISFTLYPVTTKEDKVYPSYYIFTVKVKPLDAEEAKLSSLSYTLGDGEAVAIPDFDPNVLEYDIALPSDTAAGTEAALIGTPKSDKSTVESESAKLAEPGNTKISLKAAVKSASGTETVYTVNFRIRLPDKAPSVTVNGTAYESGKTLVVDKELTVVIDAGDELLRAESFSAETKVIKRAPETSKVHGAFSINFDCKDKSCTKNITIEGSVEFDINVTFKYSDGTVNPYTLHFISRANYAHLDIAYNYIKEKGVDINDLTPYTDETAAVLKNLLDNPPASDLTHDKQGEIDKYASDLNKAADNLKYRPADYSKVDKLLDDFKKLSESDYTPETYAALKETAEKELSRDYNILNQATVDKRAKELEKAFDALERIAAPADYSKLDALLKEVPDSLNLYTAESAKALEAAANSAFQLSRSLSDNDQKLVDDCAEALSLALKGLAFLPADYSAVEEAVKSIPETFDGYTDETVLALRNALGNIEYGLDITSQEKVDGYAEALRLAVTALEKKSSGGSEADKKSDGSVPVQPYPDFRPETLPEYDRYFTYRGSYKTEESAKKTGWVYKDGVWKYFDEKTGNPVTGWKKVGNAWYYMWDNGVMNASGLTVIDGAAYYFYSWGGMAYGWWYEAKPGDWYYFRGNGEMAVSSWIEWKDKYYYVGSDGLMLKNTVTPDGYTVDETGAWVKG